MKTKKINVKEGEVNIVLAPLSEFAVSKPTGWTRLIMFPCEFNSTNLVVFARTDIVGPEAEIYPFFLRSLLEGEGISSESIDAIWKLIRVDVQS